MDETTHFKTLQDYVRYAWWLRHFLSKPNPLEKDDEFYAFVSFIINIAFPIDYFFHAGYLLSLFHAKKPLLNASHLFNVFAHFLVLAIQLHDDDSELVTSYQDYFRKPYRVTLDANHLACFLRVIDYNTHLVSFNYRDFYTESAASTPDHKWLSENYQTPPQLPLPSNDCMTTPAGLQNLAPHDHSRLHLLPSSVSLAVTNLSPQRAAEVAHVLNATRTCFSRYAAGSVALLLLGAVATLAIGATLHLTLPLLCGVVTLIVAISCAVSLYSTRSNANSSTLFGGVQKAKPKHRSGVEEFAQPVFFK